jgi:hypothetical protein
MDKKRRKKNETSDLGGEREKEGLDNNDEKSINRIQKVEKRKIGVNDKVKIRTSKFRN